MSNIYIQEPPTTGKVVMKTSIGDIDLELWTKEAPKACRNFIQLCMEGYYDNTIFHRVVKGFIAQGGDPTGTGEGGESIYGQPFKDEFHTRLRFCRRGLLAMANAGKDDNGSQFFFTLAATPELQNKHTIFGKVTGETVYNMLKLEEALVDENDRPVYPQRIIKTEILTNPFTDIVPRTTATKVSSAKQDEKQSKQSGVKNFNLLSFGEEAEEDEEESVVLNRQFSGKGKSAHDHSVDPKLVADTALVIEQSGPPSKKLKEDRSSDWESGSDDEGKSKKTPEEVAARAKEKEEMRERIKSKLRETKKKSASKKTVPIQERTATEDVAQEVDNDEDETIPYHLGKDREDERKKKAEQIKKEIRDLKRSVQSEKRTKEAEEKRKLEEESEKQRLIDQKKEKTGMLREYIDTQEKYKEVKSKMPKGKSREDFTMQLLRKFQSKLRTAKESTSDEPGSAQAEEPRKGSDGKGKDGERRKDGSSPDSDDESWMTHALRCEDSVPILAKDASTKDDDWFEIYDPRNPLNKRRRGEAERKQREQKTEKNQSRRK